MCVCLVSSDGGDEIYSSETLHTQDNSLYFFYFFYFFFSFLGASIIGGRKEKKRKSERGKERIFHTALEMMDAVSHWITEMKKISR